jgi:hypothetical protein
VDSTRYNIVFAGQVKDDLDIESVSIKLAKLFKTDDAGIARLFSGKQVLIKKGVDLETAKKYQAAIEAAGAVVTIQKQLADTDNTASAQDPKTSADSDEFSIAPAGVELLHEHEKNKVEAQDIDTSHLELGNPFQPSEQQAEHDQPSPDTSHISVAEPGADLLPDKPDQAPPPSPDTSHLDIAAVGQPLVEPAPPCDTPAPDTSTISLAPPDDDRPLQEPRKIDAPTPDISKLSIEDKDD